MIRCKHPQFRVSDSRDSNIFFTVALPGGKALRGSFADFDAMMVWKEADLGTSMLKMVLYADSVSAKTMRLTRRLMGPSCLNAAQHRIITFQSTEWERLTANEYLLYGKLSLYGTSKLVVFEVTDLGTLIDGEGMPKHNKLQFDSIIKPSDFNLARVARPWHFDRDIHLQGIVVFKNEVTSDLAQVQHSINRVFELFHSLHH
ncbi:YceI family protein [Chryseolinea soli]|uniref:Lipid/polyisoprenoid-binding YceI-like domain-containing protein n=1 Tax=Chryseolinea soli TaxID=2321403 RepID=A0A385SR09_9BACT|nr:YceI family protein [Chryseolinea soli]AYB32677.1 hypothetical protein D4L85_19775 [Chryseolinea soli]